jgi:hypothetical protein
MPPITESRNKGGTLTIDAIDFADQATGVRLVPNTDEVGDPVEVLSGAAITGDDETTWQLRIEAIQDFDDPAGFVAFTLANAGEVVPYSWRPNATGVTYAGTVKVRPVEVGGDVNKRLTSGGTWPCQQAPTPTYPAP